MVTGGRLAIGVLVALHVVVALAGFFAPYDPAEQARALPYAPPTRLHVRDVDGRLVRPFVYAAVEASDQPDGYVEDTGRRYPVRVLVRGPEYTVFGIVSTDIHLFGVEAPARIALLGTDGYGRDVLSRLLHGGRLSLLAGLLATLCALTAGLGLGALAGFYGRGVDQAVMRTADVFMAVPWLFMLFAVRAALPLHLDARDTFLILVAVIGMIGWARPARLVRGVVLSARERAFVAAARGFGALDPYILRRHVLPQTGGVLLTQAGVLIPQYVAAEITLSFLGLGVGEPVPSWGNMLASLQQYHVLTSYWWMSVPALALVPVMLGYHALTSLVHARLGPVAA